MAESQHEIEGMIERVDALEREIRTLVDSLRERAEPLSAQLGDLRNALDGLRETAAAKVEQAAEAVAPRRARDEEGARLVALNMALAGTAREEADQYLGEHYELADRAKLLDEVYERAGQ